MTASDHKREPRICRSCPATLYRKNKSGLCRQCMMTDPEMQARRLENMRRAYAARPELIEAATKRIRALTRTPEHADRARRMMTDARLWEKGIERLGPAGSPVRIKAGRGVSAARLSHIPRERRDDYRHLVNSKRMKADEATRIILDQHQVETGRFVSRLLKVSA